jgi:acyl-CoA thioesterase I
LSLQSKWFAIGIAAILIVAGLEAYLIAIQYNETNTIRVACVGDSITADANYPDQLEVFLGANYDVINFGVGRTTVSRDFEKPYYNQSKAIFAHFFNPRIVIIMLGTNDAFLSAQQRSNFITDYTMLIHSFQTLSSKPTIYIVTPPPVFNNSIGLNSAVVENEVLPLVKQTAENLNLTLIDIHTPLLGHPEYFKDGVHPNSDGANVIATQVYYALTQGN